MGCIIVDFFWCVTYILRSTYIHNIHTTWYKQSTYIVVGFLYDQASDHVCFVRQLHLPFSPSTRAYTQRRSERWKEAMVLSEKLADRLPVCRHQLLWKKVKAWLMVARGF